MSYTSVHAGIVSDDTYDSLFIITSNYTIR